MFLACVVSTRQLQIALLEGVAVGGGAAAAAASAAAKEKAKEPEVKSSLTKAEIKKMKPPQMKAELKELGLSIQGDKNALLARLVEALAL